jgi:hypothetical protein
MVGPTLDNHVARPQSRFAAFENERCFSLQETNDVDRMGGFVVPYARYSGTPGILLEEISNPPCPYFEGTFEPSFFPSHFRLLTEHNTDISVFTAMRITEEIAG